MAPTEPFLPGEPVPDHTSSISADASRNHHTPTSSRRRSHSGVGMLSAAAPGRRSPSPYALATASDSGRTIGSSGVRAKLGLGGVARRTLGIALLLIVVFLWTLSNFLASVSTSSGCSSERERE